MRASSAIVPELSEAASEAVAIGHAGVSPVIPRAADYWDRALYVKSAPPPALVRLRVLPDSA